MTVEGSGMTALCSASSKTFLKSPAMVMQILSEPEFDGFHPISLSVLFAGLRINRERICSPWPYRMTYSINYCLTY